MRTHGGRKNRPLSAGPCETATWTEDDDSWVPDEQRVSRRDNTTIPKSVIRSIVARIEEVSARRFPRDT